VDKILGYWDRGAQVKMRASPRLSARTPEGGLMSLCTCCRLLPATGSLPFRDRPNRATSAQDCHWSSMNFLNETPDDRFSDPILHANWIKPTTIRCEATLYGDIVLVVRNGSNIVHSAVFSRGGHHLYKMATTSISVDALHMPASGQSLRGLRLPASSPFIDGTGGSS